MMPKKKTGEPNGRPPFDEKSRIERVTIGLPGPMIEKLKLEASDRRISFSQLIREKLEGF